MVPYVTDRGHSFKGAGLYYLHDKGEKTSERVAWTHTVNLPTEDPQKAINWMAYTAYHAGKIKQEAGIKNTGKKSTAGPVYSYSLAWSPEQQPTQDDMLTSVLETLQILKLQDHQALIVAHNETAHPHVHVICNLVSPRDGRIKAPAYDHLSLSAWAENKEKEDGKIYCEERVENNRKRREHARDERQLAMIKHREEKLRMAEKIDALYRASDSGKAFQAALEQEGFTLARGDRRGFTIVDGSGKIHSLARQLSGQRARDIKDRLADIDPDRLPDAKTVSQEKMYYDRDRAEIERQKTIVDTAIAEDQKKNKQAQDKNRQGGLKENEPDSNISAAHDGYDKDAHLRELDAKRAFEARMQRRRDDLEKQLGKSYDRTALIDRIAETKNELARSKGLIGNLTGWRKGLEKELDGMQKTLANMDARIQEQRESLEADIKQQTAEAFPDKTKDVSPDLEPVNEKQQDEATRREELRTQLREAFRKEQVQKEKDRDRDKGRDLEP